MRGDRDGYLICCISGNSKTQYCGISNTLNSGRPNCIIGENDHNLLDEHITDKLSDIICLTEHSHTSPNAKSYQINGYNMIVYNFDKRGICRYSNPYIFITVLDYNYDFQEYIWCSVSPSKDEKMCAMLPNRGSI